MSGNRMQFCGTLALLLGCTGVQAGLGQPGANVGIFVGSGVGCNHSTIQAAVNAARLAPGDDVIAIASNRTYTAQQIVITDSEGLTLMGGFDECLGARSGSSVTISGAGGTAASVISHTGSGDLTLSQLRIADGDAINAAGGLQSLGPSLLRLENVSFSGNQGVSGGGLLVTGAAPVMKSVLLVGSVFFSANTALLDGGGIFALDAVITPLSDPRLQLTDNRALDGDGGGIYLLNSELRAGFRCSSGFALNSAARRGGAMFVHARGGPATATLRSPRPCLNGFTANSAGVAGGAIHLLADGGLDAPVATSSIAQLQLVDAYLIDNIAPDGAALMVQSTVVGSRTASALATISAQEVSPGEQPPACEGLPLGICSSFFTNQAREAGGDPGRGVVTVVDDDDGGSGSSQATISLRQTALYGSSGGVVFAVRGANAHLSLADTLVAASETLDTLLRAESDGSVSISRSTLAYGVIGSGAVLGDRRLTLDRSIVFFPDKRAVRMQRENNQAMLADVLAASSTAVSAPGFPPDFSIGLVAVDDPGFEASGAGDFRLHPDSPAVDIWALDHGESAARDLLLGERGFDSPSRINGAGEVFDLGALEYSPTLFADGFEDDP